MNQQSKGVPGAPSKPAERRVKERTRVNFLLTEDGFSKLNQPGENDPWSCTRRAPGAGQRWEAFEKWQSEARQSQAKVVDGVKRLPRKLSLKAMLKSV
ncbi:MAG: hypothetical protein AAFX85_06600 [Pseudomonadota bacterium]